MKWTVLDSIPTSCRSELFAAPLLEPLAGVFTPIVHLKNNNNKYQIFIFCVYGPLYLDAKDGRLMAVVQFDDANLPEILCIPHTPGIFGKGKPLIPILKVENERIIQGNGKSDWIVLTDAKSGTSSVLGQSWEAVLRNSEFINQIGFKGKWGIVVGPMMKEADDFSRLLNDFQPLVEAIVVDGKITTG
jgi:hypothetical protein